MKHFINKLQFILFLMIAVTAFLKVVIELVQLILKLNELF